MSFFIGLSDNYGVSTPNVVPRAIKALCVIMTNKCLTLVLRWWWWWWWWWRWWWWWIQHPNVATEPIRKLQMKRRECWLTTGSGNDEMLYTTSAVPRAAGPRSMQTTSTSDCAGWVPVNCCAASVTIAVVETVGYRRRTGRHSAVYTRVH